MDKQNKIIISIYSIWTIIVFGLSFAGNGFNPDNITHILIIAFFILQLITYPIIKIISKKLKPETLFLTIGIISAAIVEGFYMISDPVFESIKFTAGMSIGKMITNLFIDLIFTIPVYIIIFLTIWYFINKYNYKLWEYLLLFSLAQALGDGGFFFLAAPFMLIFIPYVMINNHSMNLIPYLLVKDNLKPKENNWKKYIIPQVTIITIYLICGTIIQIIGPIFV